ncbi:AAA family ATPase [Nocardia sp. NPDC049190]|uniref:helix-turn-helix transcriptional regulator n=1 Tax=Nocardia sp. NPDC049190 TaxID=3155650 RepID=UPI0033E149FE
MAAIGARGARYVALVGRADELRHIDEVLAAARSGSAGAVVIVGELGIGKSRLLGELCERATVSGFDVLTGRGTELEREIPFGLFVEALNEKFGALDSPIIADLGADQMAELAAVLPSVSRQHRQSASGLETERFKFHRAVRATLSCLVPHKPIVLALDDVHWADPASVELIGHLLRRSIPGMVLVLAYRPRAVEHLLREASAQAAREGLLRVLDLAPLTVAEAAEALGEPVDSPVVRGLHSESGGNPFYLEQLARMSRKSQASPLPAESVNNRHSTGISTALRMTITQELTGLAGDALGVLRAGAVAGDPFDVDLVAAIAESDQARVLRCLDKLVGVDLVRPTTTPGQFRFRHPVVRRVVYDEAMPGWRFDAHKQAARALGRRGAPIGTRAHHVELSASPGDAEAAATLAEAGRAVAPRAPAAAAGWFEAALRLLPETGADEQRLLLVVSLAGALAYSGRLRDSRTTLEQALQILPVDALGERTRIIGMIARADHGLGRAEDARHLLVAALRETTEGSADAVPLELALAENYLMRRQWAEGIDVAMRARGHAEALGDSGLLVAVNALLALLTNHEGDKARSKYFAGLVADHIDASDVVMTPELLEPLANLADAEVGIDQLREASRHAERGLTISRATGHGHVVARFMVSAAAAKMFLGNLREARPAAESAVEMALLLDNDQLRTTADATRCYIETWTGELSTAIRAGRAAVHAAARTPGAHYAWLARGSYGQALIEAGEFDRGRREILLIGGPDLSEMPPTARSFFEPALVKAELAAGRIDAAEAIARRMKDFTFGLRSREAQAHYADAQIYLARGDFPAAVAAARQAHEAFHAAEMAVLAARAQLMTGRALARTDQNTAAIHELEMAYGILRDAGAARLADEAAHELRTLGKHVRRRPEANEPDSPSTLTGRERDIADRVVQGYTNREIAAQLFISPKTVEKHLARVFAKLGTSSRSGVAAAMNGHPADSE